MRFKKISVALIMTSVLLAGCGSGSLVISEQEVKISDTGAYTTMAENTAEQIFTSEDGIVVIKPSSVSESSSSQSEKEELSFDSVDTQSASLEEQSNKKQQAEKTFTMPEQIKTSFNGSVGHLSIDKIKLIMDVFETDNAVEDMKKGAAHFKDTSIWEGNVGLSAHNDGVKESVSFGKLNTLEIGDEVKYKTSLGERSYEVSVIEVISDEDWSYLSRTEDNRITLITCVKGEPSKRLMVQAIEA